jgi:hypothetical protein
MGFIFGGGGGGGFTPMSSPTPPPAPVYTPDPALAAQRDAANARADVTALALADRSSTATLGKYMGTQGARALFTSTAAGYGKTLGNANVGSG